jgi:hypothetical protein
VAMAQWVSDSATLSVGRRVVSKSETRTGGLTECASARFQRRISASLFLPTALVLLDLAAQPIDAPRRRAKVAED